MGEKNFIVIGGSRGIGLGITRKLSKKHHNVIVVSRSPFEGSALRGVSHIPVDLTCDNLTRSMLPAKIQGVTYCPGSIRLLPFHRLSTDDVMEDMRNN